MKNSVVSPLVKTMGVAKEEKGRAFSSFFISRL